MWPRVSRPLPSNFLWNRCFSVVFMWSFSTTAFSYPRAHTRQLQRASLHTFRKSCTICQTPGTPGYCGSSQVGDWIRSQWRSITDPVACTDAFECTGVRALTTHLDPVPCGLNVANSSSKRCCSVLLCKCGNCSLLMHFAQMLLTNAACSSASVKNPRGFPET